ncbi:hypothetical protein Bca4012_062872 [Brassica carinata]
MGLTVMAHQCGEASSPSLPLIQNRVKTKQNRCSVSGEEELATKNRFDTLSRLVNVES